MKLFRILLPLLAFGLIALPARAADLGLYHALGDKAGIEKIVGRTADLAFKDPVTGPQFAHTKKPRLVKLVSDQICALVGGPCRYKGLNMKKAHYDLGITEHEFNAFAECLRQAMEEAHVGYHAQNRLLALLAPMKRDVVER